MTVEAFAPAKINLTLHVTGQRADGYHLLDSLVMFADVGDRITVEKAVETSLTVTGPMSAGVPGDASNLVYKAAAALGVPARIRLEKHLPNAAGIGGGSSDAAATLRALTALSGQSLSGGVALKLGADVPVCLTAGAARMSGIGDEVSALPGLPGLPAVLVNPGVSVATPVVFRALACKSNPSMPATLPEFETAGALIDWLATQRNDLEAPAILGAPVIEDVLEALRSQGQTRLARMSGSGATCFALCETRADAQHLVANIHAAHPDWWVAATTLT